MALFQSLVILALLIVMSSNRDKLQYHGSPDQFKNFDRNAVRKYWLFSSDRYGSLPNHFSINDEGLTRVSLFYLRDI